ncbi:tetratricopeptide repeat protein [Streptomyces avermitilis]|uniref:tetratricopeptide repeat protein n=1 Tax=Streptomyces avermitilis TaxID=33903 RepID=UPI0033F1F544
MELSLSGGHTTAPRHLLIGMGGVGKTQIAARYARRAQQTGAVDLLVWVDASTRAAVVDRYAQAAAVVMATPYADAERAAADFLAWLEPKTGQTAPCRWLVVLDDVVNPADLRGLWPPASSAGRVLVTTRRRDAALTGRGPELALGLFDAAESAAYLTDRLAAAGRQEPPEHLAAVAADLGHLPLALSQAAAYIVDTALPVDGPPECDTYRARLADRATALADLTPDALPDDQDSTRTVGAAWALSLDHANGLTPKGLAQPMLQLAAMLDPSGIPMSVLTGWPALAHLARYRARGRPITESAASDITPEDALGALRALHRLSLLDHNPHQPHQTARVHRIIQRSIRDRLTVNQHLHVAQIAADALFVAWPDVERDTALIQSLHANASALMSHAEEALYQPHARPDLVQLGNSLSDEEKEVLPRPHLHPVLVKVGNSLGEGGQPAAARDHFARLATTARHHLGADHTDVLSVRSQLATWRGRTGDAVGAADAFVEVLEASHRLLGPRHPISLVTCAAVADWQGVAGNPSGAAHTYTSLIPELEQLLGSDSQDVLVARNNLALWQGEAGDAQGAAAAFDDLLNDRLRVLGPDHPETLATRASLASWQGEAGDAQGAAAAFDDLLNDRLRVLGPDHPETLATRASLASWQGRSEGTVEAAANTVALLVELLSDTERDLGAHHPDILRIRASLAYWRGSAGDAPRAAVELATLLPDMYQVLGAHHPVTLTTRVDLAHWRGKMGDAAGAITMMAGLLPRMDRVLDPSHPTALAARKALLHWLDTEFERLGELLQHDRVSSRDPDASETT